MRLRRSATVFAGVLVLALAAMPAAAQQDGNTAPQARPDLFKSAGNFLENCDARADEDGERPEETYLSRLCLSYVDGLIAGYTVGALSSGNDTPYCLPRPVTLVEVMDMMATVIDRGVPPDRPTAQVFHYLVQVNFPCDRAPGVPGDAASASDDAAGAPDDEDVARDDDRGSGAAN